MGKIDQTENHSERNQKKTSHHRNASLLLALYPIHQIQHLRKEGHHLQISVVYVLYSAMSCSSSLPYRHDGTDKKKERESIKTDLSHTPSCYCPDPSHPDK